MHRRLGENAVGPQIAFLTANAIESFKAKARETGGDTFLTKPLTLGQIESLLQSLTPLLDAVLCACSALGVHCHVAG